jgi:molecular chaperone GrpE
MHHGKKEKDIEEKDGRRPTEVETEAADEPAPGARVYDLDPDPAVDETAAAATEKTGAAPEEAGASEPDEVDAAGGGEATAASPREKHGRPGLKVSRRELLDRFAEKNSAITRLMREKSALEKSFAEQRDALANEKAALEAQVKDLKDKWLRTAAEFENYRKRSAREWDLLKQQARSEVILEVLNSLDDFERAFAVAEDDGSEFVKGIRLIYGNLLQVLQKLGVAEIDALHQPFDPVSHMAIGQTDATGVGSGRVAQVVRKGYTLNGSVIRPAHVIVAK